MKKRVSMLCVLVWATTVSGSEQLPPGGEMPRDVWESVDANNRRMVKYEGAMLGRDYSTARKMVGELEYEYQFAAYLCMNWLSNGRTECLEIRPHALNVITNIGVLHPELRWKGLEILRVYRGQEYFEGVIKVNSLIRELEERVP